MMTFEEKIEAVRKIEIARRRVESGEESVSELDFLRAAVRPFLTAWSPDVQAMVLLYARRDEEGPMVLVLGRALILFREESARDRWMAPVVLVPGVLVEANPGVSLFGFELTPKETVDWYGSGRTIFSKEKDHG
jgi:hypothetical protein